MKAISSCRWASVSSSRSRTSVHQLEVITWLGKSLRCELGAISGGRSASWKSCRNNSSMFQFFLAEVSTNPQPANVEHKLLDSSDVTVLKWDASITRHDVVQLPLSCYFVFWHQGEMVETGDDATSSLGRICCRRWPWERGWACLFFYLRETMAAGPTVALLRYDISFRWSAIVDGRLLRTTLDCRRWRRVGTSHLKVSRNNKQ